MRRPPLNDLSAFIAVAGQRSFRKAAVELGISPSALSHAVRALEQRLDVRLLNRTTRSVSLTEAGARLAERLSPALASVDEALAELRDDREQVGGRIRITTMEHGGLLLADVLPGFRRAHPAVQVELSIDNAMVDLAGGGFDAGVRLRDQVPPDMVALPIAPRLSLAAVASPEYLRSRGAPETPSDLASHDCLRQRLASGSIHRWEFEDGGREFSMEPASAFTSNSLPVLVRMALGAGGVCYVPSHHVASHVEAGRLTRVLQRYSPSFDGHCLYYPPYRQQVRAFAALVAYLRGGSGPPGEGE